MRRILFSILAVSFSFALLAKEMTLKEKLLGAEEGSYLVFEQNKCYTFFYIYENKNHKVVIEEVSIPATRLSDEDLATISQFGFRKWFESGSPKHTSWTMSLINLDNGQFEEMYSYTQRGWIDVSKLDNFMTTLLNLPFEEIPDSERKRIGLPPGRTKTDTRPLWQPRLIVEGHWIPNVKFQAWKARWPADTSDLSRKIIELYLPEESNYYPSPPYPTFFPYVVEVEGKIGSAKIRVVDSGIGAKSQSPRIPLRPPQFLGAFQFTNDEIIFTLKAPIYFEDFILLAEEDTPFSKPFPLTFSLQRKGEQVIIVAKKNDLQKNGTYRLLVYPKEHPAYCLQSEALQIP